METITWLNKNYALKRKFGSVLQFAGMNFLALLLNTVIWGEGGGGFMSYYRGNRILLGIFRSNKMTQNKKYNILEKKIKIIFLFFLYLKPLTSRYKKKYNLKKSN